MLKLEGKRFGELLVLKFHSSINWSSYWVCKCSCDRIKLIRGSHLIHGKIKSCGYHQARRATHGYTGEKVYQVWKNMKKRCLNKNYPKYKDYGGRGIKVCDRWIKFENFLNDMGESPDGLTLERVDNNGNYEPGNCKWASYSEQNNNKRTSYKNR